MFKFRRKATRDDEYINSLRDELTRLNKWKEIYLAPSTAYLLNVLKDTIKDAEKQWAGALTNKPDTDIMIFRSSVLSKINTLRSLIREIEGSPERCLNIEQELSKINPPEEDERGEV